VKAAGPRLRLVEHPDGGRAAGHAMRGHSCGMRERRGPAPAFGDPDEALLGVRKEGDLVDGVRVREWIGHGRTIAWVWGLRKRAASAARSGLR
jgi:hypothetical protein